MRATSGADIAAARNGSEPSDNSNLRSDIDDANGSNDHAAVNEGLLELSRTTCGTLVTRQTTAVAIRRTPRTQPRQCR